MRRYLLSGVLGLAIMLLPLLAMGQPAIFFDGCSILNSGSPWLDHVMYVFSAQAGDDMVNDIHICVYDVDGNALEVVAVSVPGSWYGHVDPGSNCPYYYTLDNPIYPGETLGPFDFIVPPGNCNIIIEWQFTLDGVPVTDWQTVTWTCWYTDTDNETWGAIKTLYR